MTFPPPPADESSPAGSSSPVGFSSPTGGSASPVTAIPATGGQERAAPPTRPGMAATSRPGMVAGAAGVLTAIALVELIFLGGDLLLTVARYPGHDMFVTAGIRSAVLNGTMVVVAVLAALLVTRGRDGGRALGFAVAGVAGNTGVFSLLDGVSPLLGGRRLYEYEDVYFGLAIGALGVALALLLANRRTADWFHEVRSVSRRSAVRT